MSEMPLNLTLGYRWPSILGALKNPPLRFQSQMTPASSASVASPKLAFVADPQTLTQGLTGNSLHSVCHKFLQRSAQVPQLLRKSRHCCQRIQSDANLVVRPLRTWRRVGLQTHGANATGRVMNDPRLGNNGAVTTVKAVCHWRFHAPVARRQLRTHGEAPESRPPVVEDLPDSDTPC